MVLDNGTFGKVYHRTQTPSSHSPFGEEKPGEHIGTMRTYITE